MVYRRHLPTFQIGPDVYQAMGQKAVGGAITAMTGGLRRVARLQGVQRNREGRLRQGAGRKGWIVQLRAPPDAPLLLVCILVAAKRLRLQELLVAEEAGEEPHVSAVDSGGRG